MVVAKPSLRVKKCSSIPKTFGMTFLRVAVSFKRASSSYSTQDETVLGVSSQIICRENPGSGVTICDGGRVIAANLRAHEVL